MWLSEYASVCFISVTTIQYEMSKVVKCDVIKKKYLNIEQQMNEIGLQRILNSRLIQSICVRLKYVYIFCVFAQNKIDDSNVKWNMIWMKIKFGLISSLKLPNFDQSIEKLQNQKRSRKIKQTSWHTQYFDVELQHFPFKIVNSMAWMNGECECECEKNERYISFTGKNHFTPLVQWIWILYFILCFDMPIHCSCIATDYVFFFLSPYFILLPLSCFGIHCLPFT